MPPCRGEEYDYLSTILFTVPIIQYTSFNCKQKVQFISCQIGCLALDTFHLFEQRLDPNFLQVGRKAFPLYIL